MTEFNTILLGREVEAVARLTLNRPQNHNALNATMIDELRQAAEALATDNAVRVVVIAAAGKTFCAGADLDWMRQQFKAPREERTREAVRLVAMLRSIDELPKFVIGVVNGAAYGGGVGLAAVCDLVIAEPGTRFALTETRLGIIPATIAPYLHRRIGAAALRRLALHGEPFDAAEAKAIGLVAKVASPEGIAAMTGQCIEQALSCAPGAVADAKRLFRKIANGEAAEADVVGALTERWASDEAQAGIAAFFNKVKPPWRK